MGTKKKEPIYSKSFIINDNDKGSNRTDRPNLLDGKYFEVLEVDKDKWLRMVKCKLCKPNVTLRAAMSSNGNLIKHIQRRHTDLLTKILIEKKVRTRNLPGSTSIDNKSIDKKTNVRIKKGKQPKHSEAFNKQEEIEQTKNEKLNKSSEEHSDDYQIVTDYEVVDDDDETIIYQDQDNEPDDRTEIVYAPNIDYDITIPAKSNNIESKDLNNTKKMIDNNNVNDCDAAVVDSQQEDVDLIHIIETHEDDHHIIEVIDDDVIKEVVDNNNERSVDHDKNNKADTQTNNKSIDGQFVIEGNKRCTTSYNINTNNNNYSNMEIIELQKELMIREFEEIQEMRKEKHNIEMEILRKELEFKTFEHKQKTLGYYLIKKS